jgi:hypothetical protein
MNFERWTHIGIVATGQAVAVKDLANKHGDPVEHDPEAEKFKEKHMKNLIRNRVFRSSFAIACLITMILLPAAHAQVDACGHAWDGFLKYWGGKVLSQPAFYLVPWGWTKHSLTGPYDPVTGLYDPQGELAALRASFGHTNSATPSTGLPGGRFVNTVVQYFGLDPLFEQCGNPVDAYKGMHVDSTPFDPNAVGPEAIKIKSLLGRNGDAQTVIVFLNPPSYGNYGGGYNSSVQSPDGNVTFVDVNYDGQGVGQGAAITVFHELAEVTTDAWPGQPPSGQVVAGWNEDPSNINCQIGDMCLPYRLTVQVNPKTDPNSTVEIQELLSDDANGGTGHCVASYSTRSATFGIGTDYRLWQQSADVYHTETLHGWHAWSGTPANLSGQPTVASWGPNRLDVFVQDYEQVMHHASSNDNGGTNGWDSWGSLPQGWRFTNTPSATSWGAGRIDLFSTGTDDATIALWQRTWDGGTFSDWHKVDPPPPNGVLPATGPAVVTWGEGVSPAQWQVWPTHSVDADFPWFNKGNGIPLHQLHVFFLGTDGNVWHGAWVESDNRWRWNSYAPPPFKVTGDPAAAAWGVGLSLVNGKQETIPAPRFDIIWLDSRGNYWDMVSSDGGQSASCCGAWGHPEGFPFTSKPAIAALGDGRLIVGGRANTAGYDGASYQQVWDTSHLTGWTLTNGAFVGGFAITAY